MRNYFVPNDLSVRVYRNNDQTLGLSISSQYSRSNHKGQLYVNEKRLAEDVESLWRSIKTKKLLSMSVSFDEIDWYDNMTDIYSTPIVSMKRGQRVSRISERDHGSIPKDWTCDLHCTIADTTTKTPILEVVKASLGSMFTPKLEKSFVKDLKSVLQKKQKYASVESEWE